MRWAFCNDDDAVSETLGYILIFTIVLTCIAFILLSGNGILDTTKAQNNFKSMEQGLSVVSSDLTQVALEGTPVKTTRIHMEGGSISANTVNVNKMVIKYGGVDVYNEDTGNIKFMSNADSSIVSVENGGVWEKQGVNGGSIVVLKPRIYKTNAQTLVLNVIKLDANPPSAIGGSKTMDIALSDKGSTVYESPLPPVEKDVDITFYTDYPEAWSRFFEDNGAIITSSPGTSPVTVTFHGISSLIVSKHTVGVKIN